MVDATAKAKEAVDHTVTDLIANAEEALAKYKK